jgi:hypothetical protein
MLIDALELPIREGRSLIIQVKVLRTEVVYALKRCDVLMTLLHVKRCEDQLCSEMSAGAEDEYVGQALGNSNVLGTGKFMKVFPSRYRKKKKHRRKKRRHGKAGRSKIDSRGSDADDSSSASSGSSRVWSSVEDDEDIV